MTQATKTGEPADRNPRLTADDTLAEGAVILNPGNMIENETGGWRTQRPVVDMAKCTHCLICWVFCPDGSIEVDGERLQSIDLAHCKGCGICAQECPTKCIEMVAELAAQ